MSELTDSSGIATTTYDYVSDQPITGRVRKAGNSPRYKTNIIGGPLTSEPLNTTILLVPDE